MSLIVPMYHRASAGRYGNSAEMLEAHFAFMARHCRSVLPGEPLDDSRLNVCLTFDDGYFDFYAVVFPLLRKHGLRAVLAVPINVLSERADASASIRLRACAQRLPDDRPLGAYCTWGELVELAASSSVAIASHGLTHSRLDVPGVDLDAEIVVPKATLAARTGRAIDSFVLPYGRFSPQVLARAKEHYRYVFRIGSADNASWAGKLIYRVDADEMASPAALFSRHRLSGYRWRRRWNTVRSR